MAKMGNKFVAMCSVAIGLIYTGAFAVTADQANSVSAATSANKANNDASNTVSGNVDSSVSSSNNSSNNSSVDNSGQGASGTAGSTNETSAAANASAASYKDGTYTGSGRDRRGTVGVAVTIKQGKIANVQITNYVMRYSESYINPVLPAEVVQRQTYNVDVISGATSSSENFQMAVEQALSQAQSS